MSSSSSQPAENDGGGLNADPGALLRPIVEGAPHGILALEPVYTREGSEVEDFVCRFVNPKAAKLLGGRTVDELVGKRVFEYFSAPKDDGDFALYQRVMETGEPHHDESYTDQAGIQGWFDRTVVTWERGVLIYFYEVTQHKETQAALQESEKQFRMLATSVPQLVWTAGPDGLLDYVNQRTLDYFEAAREQVLGETWLQRVHPDDQDRTAERWKQSLATGKEYDVEFRLRGGGGAYRWFLTRAKPQLDDDGEVVKWFGTCTDIHDQRQLEQELRETLETLRESEAIKEAIFESALDAIITIDQESRVVEFNPAAERTFGYDRENLIGELMHAHIVPPHLREAHQEGMEHYLETGEGPVLGERIEITGMRADGTEFPIELAITPIQLEGRELFTAYLRDITDRKRWEEELEEAKEEAETASKAKSQFLANMSHELRTPLNAVIGYSEMLEEDVEEPGDEAVTLDGARREQFLSDLGKIHNAGEQLLALVNDVLDIAKIEAGEMELHPTTFDVEKMTADTAETIRPLVEKGGNELEIDCPDDVGAMHTDKTKLRQALFNLLGNAAKFTEDGRITLRVRRAASENGQDWLHFAVEDTGIGIGEDEKEKIFETFGQADTSLTREHEGTGLGLVITRNLSAMMGGRIELESEKGVGSTFTVHLPAEMKRGRGPSEPENAGGDDDAEPPVLTGREQSTSAKAADNADAAAEVGGAGDVVLVIDDNERAREIITRRLEKAGFTVAVASGGQEGLEKARTLQPTVITLDVMMPEMDGWAVLSALKSEDALQDIPVVMATIVEDENMGYMLGATDYLTKPIDPGRLARVVDRYSQNEACSVLIVEDDEATRELVRRTIEKEGCAVWEAENGRVALDLLDEREVFPDLIILDLMMPEVDGFTFLEKLRRRNGYRRIPAVVMTAKDLSAEDHRRLNGEVDSVLQKGDYDQDELLDEVHRAVAAANPAQ